MVFLFFWKNQSYVNSVLNYKHTSIKMHQEVHILSKKLFNNNSCSICWIIKDIFDISILHVHLCRKKKFESLMMKIALSKMQQNYSRDEIWLEFTYKCSWLIPTMFQRKSCNNLVDWYQLNSTFSRLDANETLLSWNWILSS